MLILINIVQMLIYQNTSNIVQFEPFVPRFLDLPNVGMFFMSQEIAVLFITQLYCEQGLTKRLCHII